MRLLDAPCSQSSAIRAFALRIVKAFAELADEGFIQRQLKF